MNTIKIEFLNKESHTLVGRLEMPTDRHPHNFALFAHCFTCTKNLSAVRNISKSLVSNGFAVLRFDFTGLGESDGDFANTNFSGNVADLVAAADYLTENHKSPTLLIGHSLGGAAAIFAASEIESIRAVATVAAPSNPVHVKHLLKSGLEEINETGKAIINLGGRDFTIKKQFLEDLETKSLPQTAKELRKPLLIMHSPQDDTVAIKNAEEIYVSAHHPKSFVSLDGADHLLFSKKDSLYVGQVISGWAKRYLEISDKIDSNLKTDHQVVASLDAEDGFTTHMKVGSHTMLADEPEHFGGNDFGPSPYELVSAGLSACTVMTLQMYAKRKGWPLEHVVVHTSHSKQDLENDEGDKKNTGKIDTFYRKLEISGSLDEKQRARLLQIAEKCPVHKTLHSEVKVVTELIK